MKVKVVRKKVIVEVRRKILGKNFEEKSSISYFQEKNTLATDSRFNPKVRFLSHL